MNLCAYTRTDDIAWLERKQARKQARKEKNFLSPYYFN